MRNICLTIMIILAVLALPASVAAGVTATIDRSQIVLDETLTLTITSEGGSSFALPDLKGLENDFRVLNRNQSSSARFINGTRSSSFALILELAPKRDGSLEIPPLNIGGEITEGLSVKVVTHAQPKNKADNEPIFIETEVDRRKVFVQEQLIFTLRIFWAVEASITEPPDPPLADVLLERLKDTSFTKIVDGREYKVFERRYAIFPQKSGSLEIPQMVVEAVVPDQQRSRNIYDMFGTRGRAIKMRSGTEKIIVQEKPAEYPADSVWLPTSKLSVAEDWSRPSGKLKVGESVTVTIATAGDGLLGAQLPPLELPEAVGIKLYQGKGEVENLVSAEGITGIRKESIALIPTRAGNVDLPEIRIPWWNKELGRVEYAVVPARKLVVQGEERAAGSKADNSPPAGAGESESAVPMPPTRFGGSSPWLLALCGLLVLAWLITFSLLLRARKQLAALMNSSNEAGPNELKESQAYREVVRACRSNEPRRARKALVAWAEIAHPGSRVRTCSELKKLFPKGRLSELIDEIDVLLYGQDAGGIPSWQGKELLAAVEKARGNDRSEKRKREVLEPLYPINR